MTKQDQIDTRVRLRKDVFESLKYFMHEQSAIISGMPGVEMTRDGVVNEVLMNYLAAKGHYPPKGE